MILRVFSYIEFELVQGSFVVSRKRDWTLLIERPFKQYISRTDLICEMNLWGVILSKTFFTKHSILYIYDVHEERAQDTASLLILIPSFHGPRKEASVHYPTSSDQERPTFFD